MGVVQKTDRSVDEKTSILTPPPYDSSEAQGNLGLCCALHSSHITDDGRISFEIDQEIIERTSRFISQVQAERLQQSPNGANSGTLIPSLNIVVQVVGSLEDLQPFLALAQSLRRCGHRVRLATHPAFRPLVQGQDLEFFNLGGDPTEVAAYMVKNSYLAPKIAAFHPGTVQRRRMMMRNIMQACWRSCFEDNSEESQTHAGTSSYIRDATDQRQIHNPFVADAIVANPVSLAHIHIAERLSIPLHIVSTYVTNIFNTTNADIRNSMPWTATQDFAHPLANVKYFESDSRVANYLSFLLVDTMIWQVLGDQINRFRVKELGLEPILPAQAPGIVDRLRIPHTYCWSPSLVPKPVDWGANITIAGSLSPPSVSQNKLPKSLLEFLRTGPAPVYVVSDSIVAEDPQGLTDIVLQAIRTAGVRAVISKRGGNLIEAAGPSIPDVIFVNECPHDCIFPHVSCVVHHGEAGITAAGIAAGKPTIAVPFFGDEQFWGSRVYKAGAGPKPIPLRTLNPEALACAISEALQPQMSQNVVQLQYLIQSENGLQVALDAFQTNLPVSRMQCSLTPDRAAVWQHKKKAIKLSTFAATVLTKAKLLKWGHLQLCQIIDYDVAQGPFDPLSGAMWTIGELLYDTLKGCGEIVGEVFRIPLMGQRVWDKSVLSRQTSRASTTVSSASSQSTPVLDLMSSSSEPSKTKWPGHYFFKGTGRIVAASLKVPGAFCSEMAQGAHNMPRLWGDKTVRPQPKIEGFASGVAWGCKELSLGVYDGIAGLFAQPVIGAVEEGPLGFVKGVGKGVAGVPTKFLAGTRSLSPATRACANKVLKMATGAAGIAGFPLKGIEVSATKAINGNPMKPIVSMRMVQGESEYCEARDEEKQAIINRWHELMREMDVASKGKKKAS